MTMPTPLCVFAWLCRRLISDRGAVAVRLCISPGHPECLLIRVTQVSRCPCAVFNSPFPLAACTTTPTLPVAACTTTPTLPLAACITTTRWPWADIDDGAADPWVLRLVVYIPFNRVLFVSTSHIMVPSLMVIDGESHRKSLVGNCRQVHGWRCAKQIRSRPEATFPNCLSFPNPHAPSQYPCYSFSDFEVIAHSVPRGVEGGS